jgi:hypothetical protein
VTFHKGIQDSEEIGSDNEHMVARLFFSYVVDGHELHGLSVEIKQTIGSDYETGPIEVGSPRGIPSEVPFNYLAFRDAAERYYRGFVGSQAWGIRLSPAARKVTMQGNTFIKTLVVEFDVSPSGVTR